MKLTLSAGHGLGSRIAGMVDSGAVGNALKEYAVVLGMCNRLALDFSAIGDQVLLRDEGYYATADDDAAKFGSQLALELHMNASTSTAAHGIECLVGANATAREYRIAENICAEVSAAAGIPNRGVKVRTDLAFLRQWAMDSVLVELAFITSTKDVAEYQAHTDAIELGLFNGVLKGYGRKPAKTLPRKWSVAKRLGGRIRYR